MNNETELAIYYRRKFLERKLTSRILSDLADHHESMGNTDAAQEFDDASKEMAGEG